jgi:D-alanyl-lipoteichoic acid acyltransferase DltB (MBOAT superfamily)
MYLFLPVALVAYFACRGVGTGRVATAWLTLASLVFYGYWNPVYLPLILASMAFNFGVGALLVRGERTGAAADGAGAGQVRRHGSRAVLAVGVGVNLAVLGFFKYVDFGVSNINWLAGTQLTPMRIVLPLGVSFFTFTQIAYIVDCYYLEVKERDWLNFGLFVTFFPHLIAGPIVHHAEMMPQFADERRKTIDWDNVASGLFLFAMGLVKKSVVADTFALWATTGYSGGGVPTLAESWVTTLAYTMQLYFDFSGYTDMALGAARMFNIELPQNFDSPYQATDLQDFWRRWHMTLSRFLKRYLYVPLGGNRHGEGRTYLNLFLTFLLGGLWHGAGWTFVAWGAMHGLGTAGHRLWKERLGLRMPRYAGWSLTFLFVHVAWVFFRSPDFSTASAMLEGMVGFGGLSGFGRFAAIDRPTQLLCLAIMAPAAIAAFAARNSGGWSRAFSPGWRTALATAVMLFLGTLYLNSSLPKEFLYFDF